MNNYNNGDIEKILFLYVCVCVCVYKWTIIFRNIYMLSPIVYVADHYRLCTHVNFHDNSLTIQQ